MFTFMSNWAGLGLNAQLQLQANDNDNDDAEWGGAYADDTGQVDEHHALEAGALDRERDHLRGSRANTLWTLTRSKV